jgi:hypothetical protein
VDAIAQTTVNRVQDRAGDPRRISPRRKYDGFRELAYVEGGGAKLVSRRNLAYKRFDDLASNLSLEVNTDDAVLDGGDDVTRPPFFKLVIPGATQRRDPTACIWRAVDCTLREPMDAPARRRACPPSVRTFGILLVVGCGGGGGGVGCSTPGSTSECGSGDICSNIQGDGNQCRSLCSTQAELCSIRNIFESARDDAGLGKDVTPHVCRHT